MFPERRFRRKFGGRRYGGRMGNGGKYSIKDDIRRTSEVKYITSSTRFMRGIRAQNLTGTVPNGYSSTRFEFFPLFTSRNPTTTPYDKRPYTTSGGIIGNKIHLKRLTVTVSCCLSTYKPNQSGWGNPVQIPYDTTDPDFLLASNLQSCTIRLAIVKRKCKQPPNINDQDSDNRYFLPISHAQSPQLIDSYSAETRYDMLPFDPANLTVLAEEYYSLNTSNMPYSSQPNSFVYKGSFVLDHPITMRYYLNNMVQDTEGVDTYGLFLAVVPNIRWSNASVNQTPGLTTLLTYKFSYYDV